ncbi:uncharacterized protein LOC132756814 [Ruditapes philippinarum]|uniref:uncharacterized protein LOC132756814 n=1 Tax=Ruditapes philippinarum TaxID=129788 RepID=UPI00295A6C05|nr:uncharacterized protein LOC132756814 [Ruditapes philippinarum]XP_060603941.1 uncharacterized protein LOC132756814 [Ruditapes philippinarum]
MQSIFVCGNCFPKKQQQSMEDCTNLTEDECAEILVKTEEVEPRGTFCECDRKEMTSFERLVHTAIALEGDPRDEHSYAYSDKKKSKEGMDKDHSYYFGSRLDSYCHRKIQSLSYENLVVPSTKSSFNDKYFILPHYRSNDSALDVTGFDNISEKCLSVDNLNVKTVDVFTQNCILPGVSDPDLSMMSIQGRTSFSLPNSPPSSEIFVKDHSYVMLVPDYRALREKCIKENRECLYKDHTYINYSQKHVKRRDSLPSNVGIKRGRSNDDLSLLGSNNFKRKDFTKSPFLDDSYQSVEVKKEHTQDEKTCASKCDKEVVKVFKDITQFKLPNKPDTENESGKTLFVKQGLLPGHLLMDHTYEEMTDSSVDVPSGLMTKTQAVVENELAKMFGEIKTEKSDHCYVTLKTEVIDSEPDNSCSDSGTESLNEEDEFHVTDNKPIHSLADKQHKEHPYFKRTIKKL